MSTFAGMPNATAGITGAYPFEGSVELFQVSDDQRLPVQLSGDRNAALAQGFTLAQPHWSSAYHGYGTGSLERDVIEIEACVKHLRQSGKQKVILMGHSTGCQGSIQYLLTKHQQTPIDGAILQAPCSDREAFAEEGHTRVARAAKKIHDQSFPQGLKAEDRAEKKGEFWDCLPRDSAKEFGLEYMTWYRAWSLLCTGGDDDYFSSDIPVHADSSSDHRPLIETFGKLPADVPVLCAFSGADEYFPFQHGVTPEGNFEKWSKAAAEGMHKDIGQLRLKMTVVPGASHSVKQPDAQEVLMKVVADFVRGVN
ncbi:hypothetical protein QFC20_001795 [Naganishia adeliensis]|uniref:Uncharacterized protein n=1 Tax=Naganishia adeliensis TaxID=92952 RepID=A0ACC2WPS5_9TREE|nr:hypothetical protein QFC20_001795 [Naganishia adeliensis]